eukprot:1146914-Pelagomonas_calceolata.AAC.1
MLFRPCRCIMLALLMTSILTCTHLLLHSCRMPRSWTRLACAWATLRKCLATMHLCWVCSTAAGLWCRLCSWCVRACVFSLSAIAQDDMCIVGLGKHVIFEGCQVAASCAAIKMPSLLHAHFLPCPALCNQRVSYLLPAVYFQARQGRHAWGNDEGDE